MRLRIRSQSSAMAQPISLLEKRNPRCCCTPYAQRLNTSRWPNASKLPLKRNPSKSFFFFFFVLFFRVHKCRYRRQQENVAFHPQNLLLPFFFFFYEGSAESVRLFFFLLNSLIRNRNFLFFVKEIEY